MKKSFRKILIIVNFQNFNVTAATIIYGFGMHAAFPAFITIFFYEAPRNRFAHTLLHVKGCA
ncbi:MAG TPA: hypothetical protein VFU62_07145 [Hanamia sp.]|nr:hypothetical protein [Hanamia sp.]